MKLIGLIALVGLICLSRAAEENYCDPTLCEDGLTHTACDHYLVITDERVYKSLKVIIMSLFPTGICSRVW